MTTMCADIFDSTGEILPGGEALNFAANACRYPHVDAGLLGAIGDDEVGRHVLSAIQERPIRHDCVHVIPGGVTASNRIYHTAEGDRYFKPDSWTNGVYGSFQLSPEDRAAIQASDVVFTTYYCPNFADVIALRKHGQFKLAVDFDVVRDFDTMESFLPWIDFFFISGTEDILPVFRSWSDKYDSLINVTLAAAGSVTFHKGQQYRVQAVPVAEVIDTTGCGDSYHAGFVCSFVRDGDVIEAMNEGSRRASITLSHIGGF
ncbi:MAG: carbohydrate kinase [Clostridia bacterium]|nr:carbohydrate kinase [Clostridia bacterium]